VYDHEHITKKNKGRELKVKPDNQIKERLKTVMFQGTEILKYIATEKHQGAQVMLTLYGQKML